MLYSGLPSHLFFPGVKCDFNNGLLLLDQFLLQYTSKKIPRLADIVDWLVPVCAISLMEEVQSIEQAYIWSTRLYGKKVFALHLKIKDERINEHAMQEWITQTSFNGAFTDIEIRARSGNAFGKCITELSILIYGLPPSPKDIMCLIKGFETSAGLVSNKDRTYSAAKLSFEVHFNEEYSTDKSKGYYVSLQPLKNGDFNARDIEQYYKDCTFQAFQKLLNVEYCQELKENVQTRITLDSENLLKKTCPCDHFLCNGSSFFLLSPACFLR